MTAGRYALGVAGALVVFGAPWLAALSARRLLAPGLSGAPARLTEAVLAVSLLELTLQALGAVGLLSFAPTVLASALVGVGVPRAAARLALRHPDRQRRVRAALGGDGENPDDGLPRWAARAPAALALLAAGVVLAQWAGVTLDALRHGARGFDSVAYHLPWAASFAHTGQITSIRYTDFDWLTGFYPASSELIQGAGIVVMHSDVLAPVFNLVWLALALLAAWCIGAPRGVGAATLLAGALAMATPTMFFSTPGSADSDAMGIVALLAAAALWVNLAGRADPPGLLPAAAAVGLALATKLNMVIPALAISAVAVAGAPRGERARVAAWWASGAIATGGFWYLRNLIAVGNPLPYFRFGILPVPTPGPLEAPHNLSIWHYVAHLGPVWTRFFHPALAFGLGPWWGEVLAVAVIGSLVCVALGPERPVRLLGLVALVALAGYALTPGSASGPEGDPLGFSYNLRYATPALALALTTVPLAGPLRTRVGRWAALAFMGLALLVVELDHSFWDPAYSLSGRILTALIVGAVGLAAIGAPARWPRLRAPARVGAVALSVTLALAGAALAYGATRTYERGRYRALPGHVPWVGMLWRWADAQHHQRIAMSGTYGWYFAYPVYGADDSNTVVYLGRHGPHGAFMPYASCRGFRRALNAGHFHYAVITDTRVQWYHAYAPTPQERWMRGDPHARQILPVGHPSWPIEVWRLSGPLSLDCPPPAG